ncbi:GNAT family N-acetyltransferase [Dermatophilus congolensis]|nr:GNAT family N-acetyltransferase [Dermatophilus congolensis]
MTTQRGVAMPNRNLTIVPGSKSDRDTCAEVLAQAFADDEYTLGLIPARDHQRLPTLFRRIITEVITANGYVYLARDTTSGQALGCALWGVPNEHVTLFQQLKGLPTYLSIFGKRLHHALLTQNEIRSHLPTIPHWYLKAVGTIPSARGRGAGSALIQQGLHHADKAGQAAYLESSKISNIPFYEKFGFNQISTVPGRGTIDSVGMWRPASTCHQTITPHPTPTGR